MSKAKNSTQVLEAAKWILENVGWNQNCYGLYENTIGRPISFCAVGALYQVETEYSDKDFVNIAIERLNKVMDGDVVGFNDAPGRTKQEVIDRFSKAIKKGSDE